MPNTVQAVQRRPAAASGDCKSAPPGCHASRDLTPDTLEIKGTDAIQRVRELRIVGRMFHLHTLEESALENRVSKAWEAFWSHRHQYRCPKANVVLRMRLLHAVVSPATMWGITSIDPTKAVHEKIRHTHNKMARKLLGLFKRPEGWGGEPPTLPTPCGFGGA